MSDTGPLEGMPGADGRPALVVGVEPDGSRATVEIDGVVRQVSVASWVGSAALQVGEWVMATDTTIVRHSDLDEVARWRTRHGRAMPGHPDLGPQAGPT